jgi:AraC family transcriptional regulator
MPRQCESPMILQQAGTADGVAFVVRHDAPGVLNAPGQDSVLIAIHIGARTKLSCRRDGRNYLGTAVHGDIDIIPANTPSRWEMLDENDNSLLVILPPAFLRGVVDESGLDGARVEIRNRFQIRDAELERLGWAMKREMEFGCPSGRLYLDGLSLASASRLVARHSSVARQKETLNNGLAGRRLKQVLAFIEERLEEDISLAEIAEVAGISASHLNALFRLSMGLPVHRYLIQRRVERAKALLAQDHLSMAEIAASTGFAHQSHMARHMRRELGLAPRAVKRLLARSSATH